MPLAALTAEQLAYARGAPGYDGRYGWADDDPRALHHALQAPPPSLSSEALHAQQANGALAGSDASSSSHYQQHFSGKTTSYGSPYATNAESMEDHYRPRSASHPPGQGPDEQQRDVVARDRREDSSGANGPSGADRSSSSSSGFYDWPVGSPQEALHGAQQHPDQQQHAERDHSTDFQQQQKQQQPGEYSPAPEMSAAPAASVAAGEGDAPAHQDDSRLSDAAASDEAESSASVGQSPQLPSSGKQPDVDALLALASACSTAEDDNAVADAVLEL